MAFKVYVTGYKTGTTLEHLIIYFQSKGSGGGDIDDEECMFNEEESVIAFDEEEDQQRVLETPHKLEGTELTVTVKSTKKKIPPKTKEDSTKRSTESVKKHADNKPQIGEITTVIVSGISPYTTDDTLNNFFENKRRSGGGEIKHFKRVQPDVVHVTFASSEVVTNVLERGKHEIDGYLLKLQPKRPQVVFPPDKKKLFIENINPKTSKDSLTNYIEIITKQEVDELVLGSNNDAMVTLNNEPGKIITKQEVDELVLGSNNDAMVTLNNEPDINKVTEHAKKRKLEGATLKITHPPVCNSILVTGISKDTTKDSLELRFENPKYGGGEILNVIYQASEGKAIISFLNPSVIDAISCQNHTLNDSTLTTRPCHPFMENSVVDEIRNEEKIIQVNEDIMSHVSNRCNEEFSKVCGFSTSEIRYDENKKEVMISGKKDIQDKVADYFNQFEVNEIPILESLVIESNDELQKILTSIRENDQTTSIEFNEEKQCILVTGKKKKVKKCEKNIEKKLEEFLKMKEVITTSISPDQEKLMLIYSLGFEEQFDSLPNIEVKINLQDNAIDFKGSKDLVSEAKMKVYQECSKLKEDYIDVNKRQEQFLTSGGLDHVNTRLKSNRIKAMMYPNQSKRGKAKVVFVDSEKNEDVLRFISDEIFEKSCTLEDESEQILENESWMEEEKKLSNEFGVQIIVSDNEDDNTHVWLTGEKTKVERAFPRLKQFIEINTIVNESITFDEGISRYLTKQCQGKIDDIERSQKEQMVKIKPNEDGTFTLQGTKNGAKEAIKKLEDIAESLEHSTITIEQPGMKKYFKSETGKTSLHGIESELHCAITVTSEKENKSMKILPITNPQLLCTYETPEKISLKVYQDDITDHKCDVIVNAANGDLQHIGGLALAIVNKGGREIQDVCDQYLRNNSSLLPGEIYQGTSGKLPCKSIIHMVGPRWDNVNRVKHEGHLRFACEKALKRAKNDKTIAIPAVGSGIFGVPNEVCARALVDAAMEFSLNEGRKSSLKEIHFVNNDGPTAQVFLNEFKKRFTDKPNFVEKSSRRKTKKKGTVILYEGTSSSEPDKRPRTPLNGDCILTKTQTIYVVVGDLATQKADVLVNTTSGDLNLNSNPCGRALSQEAGPTLQNECNKVGRLKVGEVALTRGGNLLCKNVFHVLCTKYNHGQGEEVLRSIIKSCLKGSDSRGHTSIAFPAIGTGVLGFPHEITAKIFFEEVKQFAKKNPNTSVKDVRFVVYHQDQPSIKAFKKELKNQPEWNQASSGSRPSSPSRRELRKAVGSGEETPTTTTTTVTDEEGGGIKVPLKDGGIISVLGGDITKERTDVIAHLSNLEGSMNGGVAKAMIKKGGKEIARLRENGNKVSMYDTVLTKAGNLPAKYIAHMAGPDGPNANDIQKCITNCLQEVIRQQCRSISFPAIGTGQLGMSPEKSAKAMLTAIVEFLENTPDSINTVRIIIHDQEVFQKFSKAVKKLVSAQDDESPGFFRSVMGGIWNYFKSDSKAATTVNETTMINPSLFLKVYTEQKRTIEKVKEKIEAMSREQTKREILAYDQIEKLSKVQETKIYDIGQKNNVDVKIEQPIKRIVIYGHSEDVSAVLLEINVILNGITRDEHEKETADILSQNVKWFWSDDTEDGEEVEYDKTTNSKIEMAYLKKEKLVCFKLEEGDCVIEFGQMMERNLRSGQKTKVSRKDLSAQAAGISVPDYWDPQPKDANGKEQPVHIVQLDRTSAKHQKEYKKVSEGFNLTASSHTITKVERIQNPTLYRLYAIKKLSMDERNGSNEKILYHGTATSSVSDINQNGLNRSYNGVNGTLYGKGIYFATNAHMSTRYANADTFGMKSCMYVARVAVGQYTNGKTAMIVPPKIPGTQNVSYDSVVDNVRNPSIFVMFYDNQYYPEYLITFS